MKKNMLNSIISYKLTSIRVDKLLFEDINITLNNGDLLYVVGPNASGKTTMLKQIVKILTPTKGSVGINNKQYEDSTSYISFMNSNPSFREDQSVFDYLIYWAVLYKGIQSISYEIIDKALDRVGLVNEKKLLIKNLSLGQRKRLQIAHMLLVNRPIWVMDEPTIGLDKYWVKQLSLIITNKLLYMGIVILTTHTPFIVNNIHTQTIYLYNKGIF